MSLEKVKQVKADKPFKPADLIVYGVVLLLAAALAAAVYLAPSGGKPQGITVTVGDETVFDYDFSKNEAVKISGCCEVEYGDKITVKITAGGGYNVIEIDRLNRSVKVTDADCRSRECVFTAAITDNRGVIYCSPHRMRIQPYGFRDGGKDVTA